MRRLILAVVVCALAACTGAPAAPRVNDPGPASVHLAVDGAADSVAAILTARTGATWGVATWTADGRPVVVTDGATTTLARRTHGAMCASGGGWTGAVLIERAGGHAYSRRCTAPADEAEPLPTVTRHRQTGAASYYSERGVLAFPRHRNSRGCAHRTAPAGTRLTITYRGRTTTCVVDDRGPHISGRIVDLQPGQFDDLAPTSAGVIRGVEVTW